MIDLKKFLRQMVDSSASDIHFKVGRPPIMRVEGQLVDMGGNLLTSEDVEGVARSMVSEAQWASLQARGEIDMAYLLEEAGRFRVVIFHQRGVMGIVMRHVKTDIPGFQALGLPPVLEKISLEQRGIAIVSGTSGCGKSTTLAAMIDFMNGRVRRHIVTVEDPIEYLHADRKSVITQREIGMDTRSFATALRNVMRQDPDVIMVGEMRDRESFMAVLAAADVGRFSMTTLHSPDAAQVMLRIMDFFPVHERDQVRMQLAANLVAVVCQRLLPRVNGGGLVPAVEIMLGTPTVKKLIRDNRFEKLPAAIQDGVGEGMQTFNQSLLGLVKESVVTKDAALTYSPNPESLRMNLQGIFLDESRQILGSD